MSVRAALPPRPRPPEAGAASGSSRGRRPSRSDIYLADTPARSHVNVTWRPSADHAGFDGCLMSMSCSMVNPDGLPGAAESDSPIPAEVERTARDANRRFMIASSFYVASGFLTAVALAQAVSRTSRV